MQPYGRSEPPKDKDKDKVTKHDDTIRAMTTHGQLPSGKTQPLKLMII